ncbi:MAG: KAP family P-loop NTPase fold protein [Thermomicrobiales bacterium]
MSDYADFTILLDDPAQTPGLGFNAYAEALAGIVAHSRAEFAVGIFGSWGSGKTTLMRAIKKRLEIHDDIVTVWFTAWRYEKEPHLIVPLLDVLREELEQRAAAEPTDQDDKSATRKAAVAIARAGRAFLAGVKLSAKVPGLEGSWEPSKTIEALKSSEVKASDPLSFYHAAFVLLRNAICDFSAGGARRIVVFVDDLDRCLPANALDVLESMKLFFDVEGFVFVVGLDQEIAELAVLHKYADQGSAPDSSPVSGNDYIKKIFQVPFGLPRIGTEQLQEYLNSVARNADFDADQANDFDANVRRHLDFLSGDSTVNPREVKRLINTYVLQLKMLGARLAVPVEPNVALALQCLSFRPDWRELYNRLAADPQLFQKRLRSALNDHEAPDSVWLSGVKVAVPTQFVDYLRGPAAPLLETQFLASYVSAAESTYSSDPSILEAQSMLGQIRQSVDDLATSDDPKLAYEIQSRLARILDDLVTRRRNTNPGLQASVDAIQVQLNRITTYGASDTDGQPTYSEIVGDAVAQMTAPLEALDKRLGELRRQASIGAPN